MRTSSTTQATGLDLKQRRLGFAAEQLAASNSYRTKAVVANHISNSLKTSAVATVVLKLLFDNDLCGYNKYYVLSISLFFSSFISRTFENIFTLKMEELMNNSRVITNLANGRGIVISFDDLNEVSPFSQLTDFNFF